MRLAFDLALLLRRVSMTGGNGRVRVCAAWPAATCLAATIRAVMISWALSRSTVCPYLAVSWTRGDATLELDRVERAP